MPSAPPSSTATPPDTPPHAEANTQAGASAEVAGLVNLYRVGTVLAAGLMLVAALWLAGESASLESAGQEGWARWVIAALGLVPALGALLTAWTQRHTHRRTAWAALLTLAGLGLAALLTAAR